MWAENRAARLCATHPDFILVEYFCTRKEQGIHREVLVAGRVGKSPVLISTAEKRSLFLKEIAAKA